MSTGILLFVSFSLLHCFTHSLIFVPLQKTGGCGSLHKAVGIANFGPLSAMLIVMSLCTWYSSQQLLWLLVVCLH